MTIPEDDLEPSSEDDIPDSSEAIQERSTDSSATEPAETKDMGEELGRREAASQAHATVLRWSAHYETNVASVSPKFDKVRESRNMILHLQAVLSPSPNPHENQRWDDDTEPHIVFRFVVDVFSRCFPDIDMKKSPQWFQSFKKLGELTTLTLASVLVETLNLASTEYLGFLRNGTWCEVGESFIRFKVPRPRTLESLGRLLQSDEASFTLSCDL